MADTIAIALGANLGDPAATLAAVRPLLAELVQPARCRWSPLFRTEPVGGPAAQPPYCNAVLLVEPPLPHLPHLGVLLQEVDDSWRHPGHLAGEERKGVAVTGEPPSAPHPARGPAGQQQPRR